MRARLFALGLSVVAVISTAAPAHSAAKPRVGAAGVSVVLPPGWHSLWQSATPSRTDPVTRLVIASTRIGFGRGCNDIDYGFGGGGVAIVLVEWTRPTPGARFPPRPARFTASTLPVHPPPALECFGGRGGGIQFRDDGRRFAAFLLVGNAASAALVRTARGVLDTLTVT
jgi:hypothetical protein